MGAWIEDHEGRDECINGAGVSEVSSKWMELRQASPCDELIGRRWFC